MKMRWEWACQASRKAVRQNQPSRDMLKRKSDETIPVPVVQEKNIKNAMAKIYKPESLYIKA